MQVVVHNLLTNYDAAGSDKKAILMLHGWGDNLKTFDSLSNSLSKKYKVIRVDLPGFGSSQVPTETWGLADYASFVKEFLTKINVPTIYGLIGHSNGGAVAIKAIAEGNVHPERLILVGSAGIRERTAKKQLYKAIAKSGKAATFWLSPHQKKRLRSRLYKQAGSDMLLVPELEATFKKTISEDIQSTAAHVKVKTLLIYGQDDTSTPPRYGEILHKLIKGSTLQILSGGHFIHQDQPEKVQTMIEDFLA